MIHSFYFVVRENFIKGVANLIFFYDLVKIQLKKIMGFNFFTELLGC